MIVCTMNHRRSAIVLSIFAFLVLVCGIASLILQMQSTPAPSSAPRVFKIIAPPSAAVIKQLDQSHGFQALVSFINGSFEPMSATIKVGQTIRFTNNSSGDVWIAEITAKNTPAAPNTQSCDVPFNSCKALHPGDFFEYTFPTVGTYKYMNNLSTSTQGTVVVQ